MKFCNRHTPGTTSHGIYFHSSLVALLLLSQLTAVGNVHMTENEKEIMNYHVDSTKQDTIIIGFQEKKSYG